MKDEKQIQIDNLQKENAYLKEQLAAYVHLADVKDEILLCYEKLFVVRIYKRGGLALRKPKRILGRLVKGH